MKMQLKRGYLSMGSSLNVINSEQKKSGQRLPPEVTISTWRGVILADGSSPVPNFNAAEVIAVLLSLFKLPTHVKVFTFLGCGGSLGEYAGWYGLRPDQFGHNHNWEKVFEEAKPHFKPDRIDLGPVYPMLAKAVSQRRKNIWDLWQKVSKMTGVLRPEGTFRVEVFDSIAGHLTLRTLIESHQYKEVVGSIVCPTCSSGSASIIRHFVKKEANGTITLAKAAEVNSPEVKCPAGKELAKFIKTDLSLGQIAQTVGMRLSGKAVYWASSRIADRLGVTGLLLRDYSEDRGTSLRVLDYWNNKVGVTSNIVVTKQGASYQDVVNSFERDPKGWLSALNEMSLFAQPGVKYEITL